MAEKIFVAVKPKYPTRKAIDKVLVKNEEGFIDIAEVNVPRQVIALLDTAHVAIVKDDKYYPVDETNVYEQYEHISAGEELTVEEDHNFGVKKLDYFFSIPSNEDVEGLDKIQDKIEVYNGILSGKLVKVEDYTKLGIDAIDKNGYWFAIKFDKSGAAEEGYTEAKLFGEEKELEDGVNYIYMGASQADVSSKVISISAEYTPTNSEGSDSEDNNTETNPDDSGNGNTDSGDNSGI